MGESDLEFSSQAFSKMVMHTMKYPHSVCCGLLLSPKPSNDDGDNCENNGNIDHDAGDGDNNEQQQQRQQRQQSNRSSRITKIIEAIPMSHTSHYLAPNIEVALNSVSVFAQEQELIISGYYQTDKFNEPNCLDSFGQRVTERIAESCPHAVLCFVSCDVATTQTVFDLHHLVDGKWRYEPEQTIKIENDFDVLSNSVLYTKEKLYRQIVDFDDHFNNISLDWTNATISQRIDYLVANIC